MVHRTNCVACPTAGRAGIYTGELWASCTEHRLSDDSADDFEYRDTHSRGVSAEFGSLSDSCRPRSSPVYIPARPAVGQATAVWSCAPIRTESAATVQCRARRAAIPSVLRSSRALSFCRRRSRRRMQHGRRRPTNGHRFTFRYCDRPAIVKRRAKVRSVSSGSCRTRCSARSWVIPICRQLAQDLGVHRRAASEVVPGEMGELGFEHAAQALQLVAHRFGRRR